MAATLWEPLLSIGCSASLYDTGHYEWIPQPTGKLMTNGSPKNCPLKNKSRLRGAGSLGQMFTANKMFLFSFHYYVGGEEGKAVSRFELLFHLVWVFGLSVKVVNDY